jgi:lipoprotein-anchoring transpeptidase ErfK/SrfK
MSKNQQTSKTKKLIYLLPILAMLILVSYFGGLIIGYKNQINTDLAVLRDNQAKLETLNSKYKVENMSLYDTLKNNANSINPYYLSTLSNEVSEASVKSRFKYSQELISIKEEFFQSLEAWKVGLRDNNEFEGKISALSEVEVLKTNITTVTSAAEMETQKINFIKLQEKYNAQLELYNKKALVGGLKSGAGDIEGLILYFKKYPDLATALQKLEKYKTEIEFFNSEDNLKKFTFQELDDKLNNEIRPLLTDAVTAKSANDEKIRIQTQAQSNSEAPIKSGKVVVVNKSNQQMKVYENGTLLRESAITTGRTNWPTDSGTYSVLTKERNRRLQGSGQGATWNVFVKYWMLFNASEEEGIHDASWRNGNFGGPDYVTNGSRGCVNTPEEMMIWLFDWASIGTSVVIQD